MWRSASGRAFTSCSSRTRRRGLIRRAVASLRPEGFALIEGALYEEPSEDEIVTGARRGPENRVVWGHVEGLLDPHFAHDEASLRRVCDAAASSRSRSSSATGEADGGCSSGSGRVAPTRAARRASRNSWPSSSRSTTLRSSSSSRARLRARRGLAVADERRTIQALGRRAPAGRRTGLLLARADGRRRRQRSGTSSPAGSGSSCGSTISMPRSPE